MVILFIIVYNFSSYSDRFLSQSKDNIFEFYYL